MNRTLNRSLLQELKECGVEQGISIAKQKGVY